MSSLFTPLKIKAIEFKNRLAVSPMCEYSSVDGFANDWHLVHLGSRAVGGAALVIQEATAVSAEGRITPDDLGLYNPDHIGKLQQIVKFIHDNGSVAGIQLAHAGRKASHASPWKGGNQILQKNGGWPAMSSTAAPFNEHDEPAIALDEAGIEKVINDFKSATKRAVEVGYKVLEIHAAHGYLIHQFLSPLCNIRTDHYGGSFENRVRLLLAIVKAVRAVWPDENPLFVRISTTDWKEGGWTIEDSVRLTGLLKSEGVDLIDCSSGGIAPKIHIPVEPGYQVPYAEQIRNASGLLTAAVGLITSAKQAEDIVAGGKADMVFLAREFLRDPYFPLHAALQLHHELHWPVQYERAKPKLT